MKLCMIVHRCQQAVGTRVNGTPKDFLFELSITSCFRQGLSCKVDYFPVNNLHLIMKIVIIVCPSLDVEYEVTFVSTCHCYF